MTDNSQVYVRLSNKDTEQINRLLNMLESSIHELQQADEGNTGTDWDALWWSCRELRRLTDTAVS